ncbi:MAG: hypothetical protein KAG12_09380, partial [Desulfuromusa sp.]|nr:hypothetical protein [Desulfuromusa sp.]
RLFLIIETAAEPTVEVFFHCSGVVNGDLDIFFFNLLLPRLNCVDGCFGHPPVKLGGNVCSECRNKSGFRFSGNRVFAEN